MEKISNYQNILNIFLTCNISLDLQYNSISYYNFH